MSEVGVQQWRQQPSNSDVTTSLLPPLPDLIPIPQGSGQQPKKSNSSSNNNSSSSSSQSKCYDSVEMGRTTRPRNTTKMPGKAKIQWSTDCYEFVDELEFEEELDDVYVTTSGRKSSSGSNNSNRKRPPVYNRCQQHGESVIPANDRTTSGDGGECDDVKKAVRRRTHSIQQSKHKTRHIASVLPQPPPSIDGEKDDDGDNDDNNREKSRDSSIFNNNKQESRCNNNNNNNNRRRAQQQKHRKTSRRRSCRPVRKKATTTTTTTAVAAAATEVIEPFVVRKVDPIFLWVKQDDTKIVEVRCEDYDKRNRIRLTKTSEGWRAIPRTETAFSGSAEHKHKKKKKKKHKKQRKRSPTPKIVNIKEEATMESYMNRAIVKLERLEPREFMNFCSDKVVFGMHDEMEDVEDGIEAHIPSHTISLAAINKDKYVHAHVSHNNNNNHHHHHFISIPELEFNHQESQVSACGSINGMDAIEKPIRTSTNSIGSSYCNELAASPIPIPIPTPPPPPANLQQPIAELQPPPPPLPPPSPSPTIVLSPSPSHSIQEQEPPIPPDTTRRTTNGVATTNSLGSHVGETRKVHLHGGIEHGGAANTCSRLIDETTASGAALYGVRTATTTMTTLATTTTTTTTGVAKDASKSSTSNVCPDSAPPTIVYDTLKQEVSDCIESGSEFDAVVANCSTSNSDSENNHHHHHLLNGGNVVPCENNNIHQHHSSVLNINLKNNHNSPLNEYPVDCTELIQDICELQSANADDLMSGHCDNTMTGAELLDSLIEQRCEDNHISGTDVETSANSLNSVKNTIYTISDDYSDAEQHHQQHHQHHATNQLLMQPAPVVDIISRLNEQLVTAPKCLSFNEAGEIEGLHGDLFDTNITQGNNLHTMEEEDNSQLFNQGAMDDLSITIKNLTSDTDFKSAASDDTNKEHTILSSDSCEETPKDLTCKKRDGKKSLSPRPISHSSDTIQSPQPSGLPAVPPSPELFKQNSGSGSTKLFIDTILSSPKRSSEAQQKEPLNLGSCRKSASPTVSCSEEIKKTEAVVISDDEPSKKRMKKEPSKDKDVIDVDKITNSETARLVELLTSGNDPDPLTQFRLLVGNSAWKVPDPLLVPKDRLNAVLASPAREIPLLLTTRPELRLPEAFAFPSILQDPDILVISLQQLERILQNQDELMKLKAKEKELAKKAAVADVPKSPVPKTNTPTPSPVLPSSSPSDNGMDAAAAMFNQMLWLPYLQQMGQFNPDLLKAMMGLQTPQMPAMLSSFMQNRFNDFGMPNAMDYKRQLEAAMWQEAINSNLSMQRAMKLKSEQKKAAEKAAAVAASSKSSSNKINPNMMNPMLQFMPPNQQNFFQQQQLRQLTQQQMQAFSPNYKHSSTNNNNPASSASSTQQSRSQSTNSKQKSSGGSMSSLSPNPFFQVPINLQEFHDQQQQLARRFQQQKEKDHHQMKGGHQDNQKQPRVTCKSLSNLLQPNRNNSSADLLFGAGHPLAAKMANMSNLMAMPGMNMHSGVGGQQQQQQQQQQQTQHQQQGGKLKVKPGLSLLDPAALQRRLMSGEDMSDVASTSSSIEESPDLASPLWHPLFGSQQKAGYNSPWNWTTVTASGE